MSTAVTVRVPVKLRRQGSRKTIVIPSGTLPVPARVDITLVKALARAFRWRKLLETGAYGTIDELAKAEKINPSYVSRVLRLTLLAPDLVTAALNGETTTPDFGRLLMSFPLDWGEQRRALPADQASARMVPRHP